MPTDGRRVPAGAAVLREDITDAIRDAVFAELAEVGYGRLSIEAVARRAGVGKTAVYRRWSSKLDMVVDVVSTVAGERMDLPDMGSLRDDIEMILMIAGRALRHPLAWKVIPDLLAEAARNPGIAETLHRVLTANQRGMGSQVVARAVARGEIAAEVDPDLAIDLIVGPLYWRIAVSRNELPKADIQRLAVSAAAALGALPRA
ncbi:MAG TPA: TetR/AcrR family transcriptional regulator [Micromonosporaceae bacterium]|nr:TetR/AcrR family transcriptional regulator [Micromonosporaceae bacterium]